MQDFDEIELGYTAEMAVAEASRCLNCGLCSECLQCVAACQAHAINHLLREVRSRVPRDRLRHATRVALPSTACSAGWAVTSAACAAS
ncbi:MAG: hypothetical protein ACLP53_00005 [Isosphaeraceae bacterium]